ncbi:MAG: hypothetical protein AAF456_14850 [Planctomycetota bacterium]
MFARDLLVAAVAIGLGTVLLFSALTNHSRTFEMRTPHYLAETLGRTKARWIIGTIGFVVLMLGAYILCGPWITRSSAQLRSRTDHHYPDESTEIPSQMLIP